MERYGSLEYLDIRRFVYNMITIFGSSITIGTVYKIISTITSYVRCEKIKAVKYEGCPVGPAHPVLVPSQRGIQGRIVYYTQSLAREPPIRTSYDLA